MSTDGTYVGLIEETHFAGYHEGPCPYLEGKESRLRFIAGPRDFPEAYHALMDRGYRRHGRMAYRPECPGCNACEVLRVPVDEFRMSKSQRRVWNRCHDKFESRFVAPHYSDEKAAMYERYLREHHGNDKEQVDEEQYSDFFVDTFLSAGTREHQILLDGKLVGWGIVDQMADALSSVYFCFDPEYRAHSLGVYSALREIEHALNHDIPHYYLGYYIATCKTMKYKADYRPHQRRPYDSDHWTQID